MKSIVQEIKINENPIHLRIKVQIGSNVVVDRKAHSLTFGFLSWLACCMNRGNLYDTAYNDNEGPFKQVRTPGDYIYPSIYHDNGNVPSQNMLPVKYTITDWGTNEVTVSHSSSGSNYHAARNPHYVHIEKGGDNSGIHKVVSVDQLTSTTSRYNLDSFTPTGNPIDFPDLAALPIVNTRFNEQSMTSTSMRGNSRTGQVKNLFLGGSDKPVNIMDQYLFDQFFTDKFNHLGINVGEPVVVGQTSKIPISQSFTNTSGGSVTIAEALFHVLSYTSNNSDQFILLDGTTTQWTSPQSQYLCWARDTFGPNPVGDGETVTITYEIVVQADLKSGILAQFNNLLYRQLAQNTREVKDVYNNDLTDGVTGNQFSINEITSGGGGDFLTGNQGIQVGTYTGNIDINDFKMRNSDGAGETTRIPHGDGAGYLFNHGSKIRRLVKEDDNNAYFDIEGIFENQTEASVNVNEIALQTLSSRLIRADYPVCIARNVLDVGDRQTLQPGEFLKVTYRFSITTGNV